MIAPTRIASRPASAIRADASPAAASGMIAAATSGETAESGPRTRIRDGPEQEVHDQRHERRVEPGDRRHARELGVRHALRHEQRGEDDARDDVALAARRLGAVAAARAPAPNDRDPLAVPRRDTSLARGASVVAEVRDQPGRGGECRHAEVDRADIGEQRDSPIGCRRDVKRCAGSRPASCRSRPGWWSASRRRYASPCGRRASPWGEVCERSSPRGASSRICGVVGSRSTAGGCLPSGSADFPVRRPRV